MEKIRYKVEYSYSRPEFEVFGEIDIVSKHELTENEAIKKIKNSNKKIKGCKIEILNIEKYEV